MVCEYIFTKGKNKGNICGKAKCSRHPQSSKCQHFITKGKNKGKTCETNNCKKHSKISIIEEEVSKYIDHYELDEEDNTSKEPNTNLMDKLYPTILDIINVRGYEFIERRDNEVITNGPIFIYSNNNKVNVNYIKNIINYVNGINFNHVILIYKDTITSTVKKIIELSDDIYFELFNEYELVFNITKHILVSKHEKVSDEKLTKEINNLPIILTNDPIVKFFNFKQGDIIKITRENYISYRVVK